MNSNKIGIANRKQWIPAVKVSLGLPSKWVFHLRHVRSGIRTGDAATGDTLSAGVAGLHPMWSPGPPGPPLLGQQQHSSHILSHDHHHHHTDHWLIVIKLE